MIVLAKLFLKFIIVFLVIFLCIFLFAYRGLKKFNRKKMPTGIKYLVYKYNLDIVKIGYKKVYRTLMFCDSFIVAFLFSITDYINNMYIRLLVACLLVFPLFAGIYHLVAIYYMKKEND